MSDLGLAAGTSYSYRVRAVDAAGNLGRVLQRGERDDERRRRSTGLVAAYGFNEGQRTDRGGRVGEREHGDDQRGDVGDGGTVRRRR